MLSIIIPAHNEAACIGACLDALLRQQVAARVEVIVVANGCRDSTAARAQDHRCRATARGWSLTVLDLAGGGKTRAMNHGDAVARGEMRLYLDADVICSDGLLAQIVAALDRPEPAYASGTFRTAPTGNWFTRHYINLWTRLPFLASGVTGGGLFAVNAPGRARWGLFPDIIADDSFVRLQFAPGERIGVAASYATPMAEGWRALVRVRRRWEAGSREIARSFPHLLANEGKPAMGLSGHLRLLWTVPVSYAVYASIKLAVRFGTHDGWARGR